MTYPDWIYINKEGYQITPLGNTFMTKCGQTHHLSARNISYLRAGGAVFVHGNLYCLTETKGLL